MNPKAGKALAGIAALGLGALVLSGGAKRASGASSPASGPPPKPNPNPKPQPGGPPPVPSGGPVQKTLQAQLVAPAGGWTGGRAIINNDLVRSDRWLESPETLRGMAAVPTNRTTLGRWSLRDQTIVATWLEAGALRVPGWVDVDVVHLLPDGSSPTLTVTVSSDAVALEDLRVRGSILAAQCIADKFDSLLPTFGIVDAAYGASDRRPAHPLVPTPVPTERMRSIAAWLLEDDLIGPIGTQRLTRTVGKEYVLHPGLVAKPDHGTMYGWELANGAVIQSPLDGASFAHEATYFDYSQVVTLVHRDAKLDGQGVDLADIYQTRPELVMQGRKGAVPIRHPLVPLVKP